MTLLNIRVYPGSSRNEITERDDMLIVRVNAPAVEGKANKAACKLLAKHFGIAPSRVEIVRGHTARSKVVRLDLET